jgi:hypothetical protein
MRKNEMKKVNLVKCIASILCMNLSFQTLALNTPIQDKRAAENTQSIRDFEDVWKFFTFGATRASIDLATHGKGGYLDMSGVGYLMLPGALLFDAFVCPAFGVIGAPLLAGNIAYTHLKNKFAESHDGQKLSDELQLFKTNMHTRMEQIESLVGNRYIHTEDRIPLMLGFTLFHSLDLESGFRLANGKIVDREDFDVFPDPASLAYTSLDLAKYSAKKVMKKHLNEDAVHKALVERMTYEDEKASNCDGDRSSKRDDLDVVISYLRSAATSMNKVMCELNLQ